MPQAPEAKNNAAWVLFRLCGLKPPLDKKNTSNTRVYQTLGLPMATFALLQLQSPELIRDQPPNKQPQTLIRICLCKKGCKKNNSEANPYVFVVAHFKHWLSSTLSDWENSFQLSFASARRLAKSTIKPDMFPARFGFLF